MTTQDETPLWLDLSARQLEASLGTLVKFEQGLRRTSSQRREAGGARILLFTGVRYERMVVPPLGLVDPSRPKRKRG